MAALIACGAISAAQVPTDAANGSGTDPTVTVSSICGKNDTYDSVTTPSLKPSAQAIAFGTAPIELTVMSTEPDERPLNARQASFPDICFQSVLMVGVNVSTTGEISSFANGEGAFRGGGKGQLDPEVFAQIEELMANLPDDGHRLPEFGQRIMVRVERGDTVTIRLYDRAHLPDEILEMIRLTGARIKVVMPVFKPDKIWVPEEAKSLNLPPPRPFDYNRRGLYISPDGSIAVQHDFVTKTLTVYKVTPKSQDKGMPEKDDILRVIDEFWQPPVYGGYWVNGEFSPDGRWLLVTWGNRIGALLYDTRTWQPVTDPRLFPQNLKEYLPSSDWKLGIAVTEGGEALVWDQRLHRVLSKLPGLGEMEPAPVITDRNGQRVYDTPSAEVQFVAFSPDDKRVAVFGGPDNVNKLSLGLWEVQSGTLLRRLWPVEWMSYPSGKPLWWNDGRWLVAPYSGQVSPGGVGLWDVETGRFLGSFTGAPCDGSQDLIASGAKLMQPCSSGRPVGGIVSYSKVIEWDLDSVNKQAIDAASN